MLSLRVSFQKTAIARGAAIARGDGACNHVGPPHINVCSLETSSSNRVVT